MGWESLSQTHSQSAGSRNTQLQEMTGTAGKNGPDKGKIKKWTKRIENGEVQDTALYNVAYKDFGLKVSCSTEPRADTV